MDYSGIKGNKVGQKGSKMNLMSMEWKERKLVRKKNELNFYGMKGKKVGQKGEWT